MYGVDDRVTVRKKTRKQGQRLAAIASHVPTKAELRKLLLRDDALRTNPVLLAEVEQRIIEVTPHLAKEVQADEAQVSRDGGYRWWTVRLWVGGHWTERLSAWAVEQGGRWTFAMARLRAFLDPVSSGLKVGPVSVTTYVWHDGTRRVSWFWNGGRERILSGGPLR